MERKEEGREKQKELTRQISSVSHATKETERLVFLPDREKGTFNIEVEIKFGMKIVPANEPGTRFVVEETEKESNKEEGE